MTTMKPRFGGNALGLPGLPPTAPLSSLPSAFSRRAALFGTVAATGFLAAAGGAAAGVGSPATGLPPADARLVELAKSYETLDREVHATPSTDPGYEALVDQYAPLEDALIETSAASMVGVLAKVRLFRLPSIRDCLSDLPLSIIDDLLRLDVEGRIA